MIAAGDIVYFRTDDGGADVELGAGQVMELVDGQVIVEHYTIGVGTHRTSDLVKVEV